MEMLALGMWGLFGVLVTVDNLFNAPKRPWEQTPR